MMLYEYLGKFYFSRKDLKDKTGFSSCKIDAKIKENKILINEGLPNEAVHDNSKQHKQ